MQKRILLLLAAIMLVASGCGQLSEDGDQTTERGEKAMYRMISMQEAKELMETEENYILLDVRTVEEYEQGHIPGAICVPNEEIGAPENGGTNVSPNSGTESELLPELPDKDQLILVYCRSGNRSKQAAAKLVQMGYTNITEFGGIMDWDGQIER